MRVLVIDDDALVRDATEWMLNDLGVTVETASDGVEGLECMKREHYAFVLCDIQMPFMDGVEFVQQLREWEATTSRRSRTRVIAFSANCDDTGAIAEYLQKGFDKAVEKPASRETLQRLLTQAGEGCNGER